MRNIAASKKRPFAARTTTRAPRSEPGRNPASFFVSLPVLALLSVLALAVGAYLLLPAGADSPSLSVQASQAWAHVSGLFGGAVSSGEVGCAVTGGGPLASSQAQLMSTLLGFMNGPLVRVMAIASLLLGSAMAVTKQSVVPAMVGILQAAMLSFAPSVLAGLMGCSVGG